MKYAKPEILACRAAVEMIQGQKQEGVLDSEPQQQHPSIAAYQADE